MKEAILILDFGSQYTHLIKDKLSELSYDSILESADFSSKEINKKYPEYEIKGIVFSGGSHSVIESDINVDTKWLSFGVPILGICFGHQFIAKHFGGKVETDYPEYGHEDIKIIDSSKLLKDLPKESTVWMSHNDTVTILPEGFKIIARSNTIKNAAYENSKKNIFCVQFHPEVSHTKYGSKILTNFAREICNVRIMKKWNSKEFLEEATRKYRQIVKKDKIVIGLSGGVDSMTLATFLRKTFTKKQLIAVYIDTGLMPNETQAEVENFCKDLDINLVVRDSSDVFFKSLKRIINPREKGMKIGNLFIKEFEKEAKKIKANFFAQGTIWSDVIESGVTKFSSQIKPHHNVACLPKKMSFQLIEPFRELFKDKVRQLAEYMKLPNSIVNKKVFPGPGYAIRIQGEVTRNKVEIVRKCTKIIEDTIANSKINKSIWMNFAILIEVPSLGVKGDKRVENKYAIVVRIIESKNSMTVNFSEKAFPYLASISSSIIKKTEIGRVVYDITNKPPATIEWQ